MSGRDFTDFYRVSFPRVSSAVRAYCGDSDVAYEATQEAFARCYSRWGRLKTKTWVDGWVTTTAVNLTRKHFRTRPTQTSQVDTSIPAVDADRLDLLAALRALPDRQREAVVLYYLLDLPVVTVADLMRLSDGAVKSHLHKARANLRITLEVEHG